MADWIKGAVQHKGALRASAKSAGAMRKDGTIDPAWISKAAGQKGVLGARARLAQTLSRLGKGKGSSKGAKH